jgi:hypothetical protein
MRASSPKRRCASHIPYGIFSPGGALDDAVSSWSVKREILKWGARGGVVATSQ